MTDAGLGRLAGRTRLPGVDLARGGVTGAGVAGGGLLAEQPEADWTRVIDVNLNGTYRAIRAALPHMMRQKHGRIITPERVTRLR